MISVVVIIGVDAEYGVTGAKCKMQNAKREHRTNRLDQTIHVFSPMFYL